MKRSTLISISLIVLGFVFEYLYLGTDVTFLSIKFWLLGMLFIGAGVFGLILYTILPMFDAKEKEN